MLKETVQEEISQLIEQMHAINFCFEDYDGLAAIHKQLFNFKHKPRVQNYLGYRYIILSNTLEVEEESIPPKSAQLDWNLIGQPFQSWSQSREGAEHYLSKIHDAGYKVLIRARFQGFSLMEFSGLVVLEAEKLLKAYEQDLDANLLIDFKVALFTLIKSREVLAQEQEIVPIEHVETFEIIEGQEFTR